MAYAETTRNGVKFYSIGLSTSVEHISDTVDRIHWTATVDFGDWYYYGVRLHVKVGGVWRACGDGYTSGSWQRAVTVSGYTDAERKDADYGVWVEAYTESRSVGGYGGVGTITSCGESATISKVPAYQPDGPTGLKISQSTDGLTALEWTNRPDDAARKYYTGVNVYRHTDGGATEQLYGSSTIANYRDGSTASNHYYDYDVRARWRGGTSDMSNVVRVYKTPAPPASVSLARSGDGAVSLTVRGSDIPAWITGFEVRATADGGKTYTARELVPDREEPGVWVINDPSALAGNQVVYEVRTYKEKPVDGGGETIRSSWTASNAVATICPPYAPAVSGLDQAYPTGSRAAVRWVRNHPDGTAQTAAQVEVTRPDGSVFSEEIAGAGDSIALSLADKGAWRVRVRTKGSDPSWGAWSAYAAFTVADPPQVFFSTPGEDGETVLELPLEVAWNVVDQTGIASQRLRLTCGPVTVLDEDVGRSACSRRLGSGLSNRTDYTLELTVRGGSGLSVRAARSFRTDWLAPAAPIIGISYSESLAATVTVRDGVSEYRVDDHKLLGPMRMMPDGKIRFTGGVSIKGTNMSLHDLPPCVSFDIERVLPDGSTATIATGLESGQSVIDRLPPLNRKFSYIAVGHAASGTVSSTEVETSCPCPGFAFNFGTDAAETVIARVGVGGPPGHSREYDLDVTELHFIGGGGLPMGYPTGKKEVSETWSFGVPDSDSDRLDGLFLTRSHGWVRSHDGKRAFVRIKPAMKRASPHWYQVDISTTREVWREPNG